MRTVWHGFQSPMAEGIQNFLVYKRTLGQSYLTEEYALRSLDTFLSQQQVQSIEDITIKLIESFLLSRPRKRPRSYNHLINTIERLFNWLIKQSYLSHFPLHLHKRQETSQRIPFLFTPDMARKLLDYVEHLKESKITPLKGPTYKAIFALMYGLGLRVSEVSRLYLKDLDLEQSILVIRQTKFAKSRLIPFGPRLKKLLSEYLQLRIKKQGHLLAEEPLFSFGGNRSINRHTIGGTFHSLIPRLGLQISPGISPPHLHDLRHSFAVGTLLSWYRSGIDPQTRLLHLSTFLGHVNPNSTAVYLTITPDLLLEANRRFECYAAVAIQEVSHHD
jgi:site-specific recombinase XerD